MSAIGTAGGTRSSGTILVAEDHALIRAFLRDAFEDEGYVVAEAADGIGALRFTGTIVPTLILLDMTMPVLDGPGFVAAYRRQPGRHAPIIVMTGANVEARWLTELGAAGCVRKPFNVHQLLDAVHKAVTVPEPAHESSASTTSP